MIDVYYLLFLASSAILGVCFFILGTQENSDYSRAIIYYTVSLPFSFLTIGMSLATGADFAIAFQFGFVFFIFMDFILIILNAWKSYLLRPNRNRRYDPSRD